MEQEPVDPKYCGECGDRFTPYESVYIRKGCEQCQKAICSLPTFSENGLELKKGESLAFPAGFFRFSLNPALANGKFTRAGMLWYVKQLYFRILPPQQWLNGEGEDFATMLKRMCDSLAKETEDCLCFSDMLAYADQDSVDEQHNKEVLEHIIEEQDSPEWWSVNAGAMRHLVTRACEEGNAHQAALAMAYLFTFRTMHIFAKDLESLVWEGYCANVQAAALAMAKDKPERDEIVQLPETLKSYSNAELHAWTSDGLPIAPRAGVKLIAQDTLKELVRYELKCREEAAAQKREDGRDNREFRLKVWIALAALAGAFFGAGGAIVAALIRAAATTANP